MCIQEMDNLGWTDGHGEGMIGGGRGESMIQPSQGDTNRQLPNQGGERSPLASRGEVSMEEADLKGE